MNYDRIEASTSWPRIAMEFVGLGVIGALVAMLLTQSSYEATVVLEQLPANLGSVVKAVREAEAAIERESSARVTMSALSVASDRLRLDCRSETLSAARAACANAAAAASKQAQARVSGPKVYGSPEQQGLALYLFAIVPAFAWLALRVQRWRGARARARAEDLDGWIRQGDISVARDVSEVTPLAQPSESQLPTPKDQSGSPAEAKGALTSTRELSTRVIFRIGGSPFRADNNVLTNSALSALDEICQQLLAAGASKRVIRVASNVGSRYAKTQVAVQLATLLAKHDQRVLIVEGDVDAPVLNRVMKLEAPVGLGFSEQLQRLLQNESQSGALSVMRVDNNLHALVESRVSSPAALGLHLFGEVITQQRDHHNFIVIDGPVLDTWPDAEHLGQCVDGVVMVAAAGTRLQDAQLLAARHFESEAVLSVVKAGDWVATG